MRRKRIGAVLVGIGILAAGCDSSDWNRFLGKKSETKPWSENRESVTATVPFKGEALAADTFIRISKAADAGVVNIRTTRVVKPRRSYPFFWGNEKQSPFEDFFGGEDPFRQFFGGPGRGDGWEQKHQSLGSGFVLNKEGDIVTNNHVVAQMDEIVVTIGKDREYKAKVVGADPKTDVALIRISPKEELNPLPLGDSGALQVGEIVVAIGNPFGLSHTVTQGIVSAKERTIGYGPYDNFIQTDASINPGNSGGPLLNLKAEVIGINSAIVASGQGIGFAIPINLAKNVISQLKDKGSVTRGWLGVVIQKVDPEVARSFGLKDQKGALVASVSKGSPAAKAGIQAGDLIVRVDGREISEFNELPRLIAEVPVGKKVTIEYLRDGTKKTTTVSVGELKADPDGRDEEEGEESSTESAKEDKLGLIVGPLPDALARQLEVDGGVRIEAIDPGSAAFDKGVREGDLIVELNRKKIGHVNDYNKILKSLKKGDTILLLVKRTGGVTLFVAFTL